MTCHAPRLWAFCRGDTQRAALTVSKSAAVPGAGSQFRGRLSRSASSFRSRIGAACLPASDQRCWPDATHRGKRQHPVCRVDRLDSVHRLGWLDTLDRLGWIDLVHRFRWLDRVHRVRGVGRVDLVCLFGGKPLLGPVRAVQLLSQGLAVGPGCRWRAVGSGQSGRSGSIRGAHAWHAVRSGRRGRGRGSGRDAPDQGNTAASPSALNGAAPNVVISAISPSEIRSTSTLNARNCESSGRRR